jgi:capsular polysaccharide transport system ATP-binding protein
MIRLEDVSKCYPIHNGEAVVLNRINLVIKPGEKIGILGRNGSGKSTLIRLISGAGLPDSGKITRNMSVSWPLAFGGAFQGALTGLDNVRFICRIYNSSIEDKIEFIQNFSELGKYLYEPVRTYSSGMRARLAFAISMVVEFDCFLIDEVIAVGDSRFHAKCEYELFEKRKDRAMIIVSHDANFIQNHCSRAAVLENGNLLNFENIDDAYLYYMDNY